MHRSLALAAATAFLVLGSVACMEQHDPTRYKAEEKRQYLQTRQPLPKLTETGDIPEAGAVAAVPIDQQFKNLCSGCHGATGGGDGPAGLALNPKPRNFHDAAWQVATTDERIHQVIKSGGGSVGLSAMMAPWGSVLDDAAITEMVAYVRTLKQ